MGESKDRDRSPRRERRNDKQRDSGGVAGKGRRAPADRRVFVSNIPFEMRWQEVKDMFREQVGDVTYVEMFSDENEKPRGCGILEFANGDLAKKAVEKMHRHEYKGRKLVVKEDFDTERDRFGRISRGGGDRGRDRDRGDRGGRSSSVGRGGRERSMGEGGYGNTYGLSPSFLQTLGIEQPLHTRIFVANLAYSVDDKKLREVFRLAGRVISTELNRDKEGKSRGHGVVEFSHPVEAVQAISMFNSQNLYERAMTVRFDKQPGPTPEELDVLPSRLPEGLEGVGMGLGSGGNPLTNVAQNLPSAQDNSNNSMGGGNSQMGNNDLANIGNLQTIAALARMMGAASGNANTLGNAGVNPMANLGATGNLGAGMAGAMGGAGMANTAGMGGATGMASAAQSLMGSMGGGAGATSMGMGSNSGMGMGSNSGMSNSGMGGGSSSAVGNNSGYSSASQANNYSSASGLESAINRSSNSVGTSNNVSSSGIRSSDTILIRGLPQECNWQALREGFSHCGDIKYAEMKERGTGLIRFTSERDAERAISMMDKHNIGNRTIDVRLY